MTQTAPKRLDGFYRGLVVKHLSHGKIKVFVPGVHPAEYGSALSGNYPMADKLPDAEQISPLFGSCLSGSGIFSYPRIGAVVRCGFWNGDSNLPWYDGACLGGTEALSSFDDARRMASNAPNDAFCHLIRLKNSEIMINEEGYITIKTKNSDLSCGVMLDSDGNITLNSDTTINLHAKNIQLSADTSFVAQSGDSKLVVCPTTAKVSTTGTVCMVGQNGVVEKSSEAQRYV